jgi:glycosyltransferase involved in cell wall biosynthesis
LAASDLFRPCTDQGRIANIREKYGIPIGAQYILTVGTLEPRKNVDHLIDAFSRFVREQHNRDLYLVIVGIKGWNYGRIFSRVSQEQWLRDRVRFAGYVPDADLSPLYSGALAFAYLSLYEGFGLPPLEAMQCGVPVIASNTSSFPEVVGDAGVLVNPTDLDRLCEAINTIYHSSSVRESMTRRSLARARRFSWDKCARDTLDTYKMALNG